MTSAFYAGLPATKKHAHGACIVAGQAQGKTHYAQHQPAWTDADDLLGQYPPSQLEAKSRQVEALVALGAWTLTSTWWTLNTLGDHVAVVCVPEDVLRQRAKAKNFDAADAISQARALAKAAKTAKVPVFSSFEDARSHLTLQLTRKYATKS